VQSCKESSNSTRRMQAAEVELAAETKQEPLPAGSGEVAGENAATTDGTLKARRGSRAGSSDSLQNFARGGADAARRDSREPSQAARRGSRESSYAQQIAAAVSDADAMKTMLPTGGNGAEPFAPLSPHHSISRSRRATRKAAKHVRREERWMSILEHNAGTPGPGFSKANWLSKLTFQWINPVIRLASHRPLNLSNLWPLGEEADANVLVGRFEEAWKTQLSKPREKRGMGRALGRMFLPTILITGVMSAIQQFSGLAIALLIQELLKWYENPELAVGKGYIYAVALFAIATVCNGKLALSCSSDTCSCMLHCTMPEHNTVRPPDASAAVVSILQSKLALTPLIF
jgi:hypothetical protein